MNRRTFMKVVLIASVAGVAQLAEQLSRKQQVGGSSPLVGSTDETTTMVLPLYGAAVPFDPDVIKDIQIEPSLFKKLEDQQMRAAQRMRRFLNEERYGKGQGDIISVVRYPQRRKRPKR